MPAHNNTVAIYARYSSDHQREASIEDQIRLCRERCDKEGWTVVECYTDRAISGASLIRPAVQSLIADALAGKFAIIVAEAMDRLSRDQEDIAGIFKRMEFAGVKIITLSEGEINHLHVGLKGTMNALFLKDLADKTRRGLRGRVEAGKSGGGNSYGYDVVKRTDSAGEAIKGERTINKAEAIIVKRIMTEYVSGISPLQIVTTLNKEGIASPSGKGWGQSTINGNQKRGTGILNNELYIGRLVWNRLRYMKDPDTGRRISRLNPPEELIIQDVQDLRIIDQELWDQVKIRQKKQRQNQKPRMPYRFRDQRRPKYLLSGLLRCGRCHGVFTATSKSYFGCSTRLNKGTCDNHHYIKHDRLETVILNGLKHHLIKPEYFKSFCEEFTEELKRLHYEQTHKISDQKREHDQITKDLTMLLNALKGGSSADIIVDEMRRLELRQKELAKHIETADQPIPLIHPKMADLYHERLQELYLSLQEPETRNQAMEIIRSLIDYIELVPVGGELKARIHGDIAGLFNFMSHEKTPTASADRGVSFEMVAGVGFEPTTFRL
ncbi:MAG: recombinase family protein [Emcibacter sp.]|nr:recombinase family protein [Emcibacter sp.]